jgi:hypothetical protein
MHTTAQIRLSAVGVFMILLVLGAVCRADEKADGWTFLRLGPLGEPYVAKEFPDKEVGEEAVRSFPANYIEMLSTMVLTAMTPLGDTGLGVAWYPADGAVAFVRLEVGASGPALQGDWLCIDQLPPTVDPDEYYSADDRIMLALGTEADGDVILAYVHPWDRTLVVWSLGDGTAAPSAKAYALPWDTKTVPLADIWCSWELAAAALDSRAEHVCVAFLESGRGTHFAVLDREAESWQLLPTSESRLGYVRLTVLPDGSWGAFGEHGMVKVTEHGASTVDPDIGAGKDPALLVGSDGAVHLFHMPLYTGKLVHVFQTDGQWSREVVEDFLQGWDHRRPRVGVSLAFPSACMDEGGRIHLAYYDYCKGRLKHAWLAGDEWMTEIVTEGRFLGGTSIAVRNGMVLISYTDSVSKEVRLASRQCED